MSRIGIRMPAKNPIPQYVVSIFIKPKMTLDPYDQESEEVGNQLVGIVTIVAKTPKRTRSWLGTRETR
jgi:hypothetical protein